MTSFRFSGSNLLQSVFQRGICDEQSFLILKILFLERGGEGERGRETSMCGRLTRAPYWGREGVWTWPVTQACALTGNELATLWFAGLALNPLRHTSQGSRFDHVTIEVHGKLDKLSKVAAQQ